MKVALYTRVSTTKQEYENQLAQLKTFCGSKGWEVISEYSETISGKESNRPIFKEMLDDAGKRKFDAIVVWALDRFTREGTEKVWYYLSLLNSYGVRFVSYQEPFFNTDNEMVRDILISVMGTLAKQERLRIGMRTKAGLERARAKGVKLGKPKVKGKAIQRILELGKEGKSIRQICKEVYYWDKSRRKRFVSVGLVHKTLSKGKLNNLQNKPSSNIAR